MVITGINNVTTLTSSQFSDELSFVKPGENITLKVNDTYYNFATTGHPDNPRKAYLGVIGLTDERNFKGDSDFSKLLFNVFLWIISLLQWIFVLSFGIGMANLLPLGPVDGGRILQIALHNLYGDKEKADVLWKKVSLVFLFILAINILFPIIKALFGKII